MNPKFIAPVLFMLISILIGATKIQAQIFPSSRFYADNNMYKSVAVLPLRYSGEGSESKMEDMPFHLQDLLISYLSQSPKQLDLKDPATLNALLFKNEIRTENIRQFAPKELAQILKADYVVIGTVVQEPGKLRTISTRQRYEKEEVGHGHHGKKTRTRGYSHGTAYTVQDYHTDVTINIYNAAGERIFSNSRQSILSDNDAYKAAMHYIIKRTPLYK